MNHLDKDNHHQAFLIEQADVIALVLGVTLCPDV